VRMTAKAARTILVCIFALSLAVCAAAQEKLDLETVIDDKSGLLETEMQEAGPGDNKLFTITTDGNIASLEIGDLYRNPEGAFFKVTAIRSKSAKGGTFTIQRTAGNAAPGKKFNRVTGVGPLNIVARTTLLDMYIMGGPFLHPIAALFVAMVILAVNSILLYRRKRQLPDKFIIEAEDALDRGDIARFEAISLKEKGSSRSSAGAWPTGSTNPESRT